MFGNVNSKLRGHCAWDTEDISYSSSEHFPSKDASFVAKIPKQCVLYAGHVRFDN